MRRRVLIVDDFPDAASMASMLLSLLGHDCRYAETGQDALREARAFQPEVGILDIGLPDVSGFDLARQLREEAGDRPMFLAAITGWGQADDRIKAFAAGFDQHVVKPTDHAILATIMEQADQRLEQLGSKNSTSG